MVEEALSAKYVNRHAQQKRRMLGHIASIHKGPISKVYGRYKEDPSFNMPARTARRRLNTTWSPKYCHKTKNDTESDDSDERSSHISGIYSLETNNEMLADTNHETGDCSGFEVLQLDDEVLHGSNEASSMGYEQYADEVISGSGYDSNNISENSFDTDTESTSYFSESSCSLSTDSPNSYLSSGNDSNDDDTEHQVKTWKEPYSKEESFSICTSAYIARFKIPGDAAKHLDKLMDLKDAGTNPSLSNQNQNVTSSKFKCVSYCSTCFSVYEGENYICQTDNCGNYRYKGGLLSQTSSSRQIKSSFIIADIESQLKQILEKKDMWKSVQEMKKKSKISNSSVRDIIDGMYYQHLCSPGNFLHDENSISALFNTYGVPLYSSSNVKLWPIFLAINELPINARFSRENIVLAAIWQGKDKPPFLQYMWMFGEEMCRLRDVGFTINPPGLQESVEVKLSVLCGTVDLQAKAYILNMSMFNGAYGCSTCEEIGIVEKRGRGHSRYYPYREEDNRPPLRSSDDIKYSKGPNAKKTEKIKGISGISGLSSMPWFDLVLGILPDYMHGVLMGVTKKLLYLWFSPTSTGRPYFIGKSLKIIAGRLLKIFPPDYVERLPRDIEKHYMNFKATELQTWLLYYSIPCLKGLLPEQYHAHLCMLSEGVYLLLGDNILEEELSRAEVLLETFYQLFPDLYGKGSCGLNFHNVGAHLAFFVKQWGPLWAWSCFPFEDANAALLNSIHGTGDVTRQCIRIKELELKLRNIDLDRFESEKEKSFLNKMTKSSRTWKSTAFKNCSITGRPTFIGNFNNIDWLLESTEACSVEDLKKIHRVQVNGQKLYCKEYIRMKRRICYIVCTDQSEILSIHYFALNTVTKRVFAVCDLLSTPENCFLNAESGRQIMKVEKVSDRQVVILVDKIQEKVFYMEIEGNMYVARMPNLFGHCVFK